MCRSQLETKCLKNKTHTGLKLYKKQKNFCFKLRKKRQKYNESVDMKNVLDNKEFRKQFLSDKKQSFTKLTKRRK